MCCQNTCNLLHKTIQTPKGESPQYIFFAIQKQRDFISMAIQVIQLLELD